MAIDLKKWAGKKAPRTNADQARDAMKKYGISQPESKILIRPGDKEKAATAINDHFKEKALASYHDALRSALADARLYVTDFDKDGTKAKKLYERLDRFNALLSQESDAKSVSLMKEMHSMINDKIGPASRATLEGQTNAKKK